MHYVYTGKFEDEIVYVGKGFAERDSHLNSGCSNIYEANKLHFSGFKIKVERVFNGTDSEVTEFEQLLISEILPRWNKVHIGNSYKRTTSSSKLLGVSYYDKRRENKWRAWYRFDGKKKHIGYFETEQEAAIARDEYLIINSIPCRLNNCSTPV